MPKMLNLSGQRFSKLTVILKRPENDKHGHVRWECICDCGSVVIVTAGRLKSCNTRSCGCLGGETRSIHGMANTSEYRIWAGIKARCYNKKYPYYKNYGGRGITMPDEWKESFEAFYRDMGPRPSPEHSIDRKDNNKGYSKKNCRWATKREQANNRRSNILFELNGERKTLREWCRILDLKYPVIYSRIYSGLSFEEAISK